MDVAIIGAGSIGLLYGSYMAEAGLSVTMLVRQQAQEEALNGHGICRYNKDGTTVVTPVNATMDYIHITRANIIIIAVKYNDLTAVLTSLKNAGIRAPLLFIQNGIGHLQAVSSDDFPNVAFSTVEHGALKEGTHTVRHNGIGQTTIGVHYGEQESFQVLENIKTTKFPIQWHEDVAHILFRKVLINCLINPLTTILRVPNGLLIKNPNSYKLMENLYHELIGVFPEMQHALSFEDVEGLCIKTAENTSSMLADYTYGRPMEIETIVSAVIQRAENRGKALPLLTTYEQLLFVLDRKARKEL